MHWQADSPTAPPGKPCLMCTCCETWLDFSPISLSPVNSEASQKTLEGRGKFLPYHHLPLHVTTDMITAVGLIFLNLPGHRMALSGSVNLCVLTTPRLRTKPVPRCQGLSSSSSHVIKTLGEGSTTLVQQLRGDLRTKSLSVASFNILPSLLRLRLLPQDHRTAATASGIHCAKELWLPARSMATKWSSGTICSNREQNDKWPASQSLLSSRERQIMKQQAWW